MEQPHSPLPADYRPLDPANARRFVEEFTPMVASQLARFRLPHDLLQDGVQETLVRCLRGLEDFRGEAKLSTWVYRIAYREGLRAQERLGRARRRALPLEPAAEPAAAGAAPDHAAAEADELARVRAAMATLPEEQRLAMGYHYLDGLAVAEIAGLMDSRPNTVKSWLKRGHDRLREILGDDHPA